ncbi:MAG TPA: hypothetical protein V6C86_22075 [Oculatellaceae cyanobacterium]
MSATKSVVKHRYFKGERAQRGAGEYTRYVEYRRGDDREDGKRKFFDRDDAGIEGAKVRELWPEQGKRGPVMHELILSPGLNTVDQQEYTREVMDKLSRSKGQELQWYGVEHKNTEHHHIHVLIAGKDAEGREVRINRNDHKQIKDWGDRYLDREHQLDRYLQREEERLPITRTYDKDRGDALFDRLLSPEHDGRDMAKSKLQAKELQSDKPPPKAKEWDKERAIAELSDENKLYRNDQAFTKYSSLEDLKAIDKALQNKEVERATKEEYAQLKQWIKEKERYGEDFHENKDRKAFEKSERERLARREKRDKKREEEKNREANREFQEFEKAFQKGYQKDWQRSSDLGPKGRQQRTFELYGRTSDVHANYHMNMNRQRLKDLMERDPENKERYQKELDELNQTYREEQKYRDTNRETETPRKGREQRRMESYGRDSDSHDRYQMDQNRQRLKEAMERDPENKDRYQQELDELNKSYREEQKYRETSRDSEPERERQSDPRKGREQRRMESFGRGSDAHDQYQMNQNRQRLKDAMERDPENAEQYQKELDWLRESYADQQKDFERLDLDDIFGRDDREKTDEREKKDEREKGEGERAGDDERKPEDGRDDDKGRTESREESNTQQEDQGVKGEESSQAEDAPVLEEERELEPDELQRSEHELDETKDERTTSDQQIDITEPKPEEVQQLDHLEIEQSIELSDPEPEPKPDEERTNEERGDERQERHERDDRDDFGR